MSCHDVASILDAHSSARLAPAERAQVDEHLAACGDCAAAWHAHTELLALPLPRVPDSLLERALRVSHSPQRAERRSVRFPVGLGSALLAGAALAAGVTIVSGLRAPVSAPARLSDAEPQAPQRAPAPEAPVGRVEAARGAAQDAAPPTAIELVETALSIAPIVRRPPDYPPRALEEGLEGHVQVRFDVTAAGVVENLSVVESSDARFEESAMHAVADWRYLPRIAAGKRVRSEGIRTVLRFALGADREPPDGRQAQARQEALRESLAFSTGLEIALDRLAADDLRGAELQLDEMQALFGADRADLWSFYGYLYTVQGNYDRAIDAYERSVALYLASNTPRAGPWVPLANLYFARHQYGAALETLLRPQQATNGAAPPGGTRRLGGEAEALLERLRALGVTEEAL